MIAWVGWGETPDRLAPDRLGRLVLRLVPFPGALDET